MQLIGMSPFLLIILQLYEPQDKEKMCHVLITGLKCIVLPCHSWFYYLIIMYMYVLKMTEALSGVVKLVIGSRLPERCHNQQFLLELPPIQDNYMVLP